VLALANAPATPARANVNVAWHVLNTKDVLRAAAAYRDLFGWEIGAPVDLGAPGVYHPFSWQPGGERVGVMTDIAGRAYVHPHWLFHFPVASLDAALLTVGAAGGVVIDEVALPSGARIAVCDDKQGAAFALQEPASPAG
jgi:predicted enzyme related to lactoylglutathione lyase